MMFLSAGMVHAQAKKKLTARKSTVSAGKSKPQEETIIVYNEDYEKGEELFKLNKPEEAIPFFEKCVEVGIKPIIAANYINGIITSYINEKDININDFYLKPEYLKQINDAKESGILSSKGVKEVFYKSLEEEKEPKNFISKEDAQVSDENLIESIIDRILSSHEKEILEYKNGRTNIFDFFVGQVMKETRGKANPIITKDLLHKKLD